MPITITADRADELPEPIRASAKEEGGKFVLGAIPEGWGLDHVAASRQKATKLEQDLKRRDDRLKGFVKDEKGTLYEPDEFAALLAEHKSLKEAQGKQPDIDKLRKQIADEADGRWSKKYAEVEKLAAERDRELDTRISEAEINLLVAEMRPKEGKAEIVKLLLRDKLGIDKTDGKRVMRVRGPNGDWLPGNGQDGYTTPKSYAMDVLRTQHADLFLGDGQGGAGAGNSSGGGRRGKYTFNRADIATKSREYLAMKAKAKAEGVEVEIVG